MNYLYEVVKYNKNLPAMILMQNKQGWRCKTDLHWHKEFELVYMIEGHLDIYVNGINKAIDNNDLFFCNSKIIHKTDVKDDNAFNRYLVILLSYDFIQKYFENLDSVVFDVDSNPYAKNKIISSMKKIVEICNNKNDVFGDIKKYQELLNIYYQLLKHCAVQKKNSYIIKTPKNFACAKKVIEYIGVHYNEDITISDMAQLAKLSPAYFSKYFKNITGTGFVRYLNSIRLEHALKDMITQGMSVTDAAYENGFPNVKSFITICKTVYGMTPTQYHNLHPEY